MTRNLLGTLTATWGIAGVLLLIGAAMVRLTRVGLDAFDYPLQIHHWAFLVVFLLFMLISEGYRGFQKSFAPRVADDDEDAGDAPGGRVGTPLSGRSDL